MTEQPKISKGMNVSLWIAQVLVAASLLMGTVMKFMPIEKISAMMPWMGQMLASMVRFLGLIDLLGAIGLVLPAKPKLTVWAAMGIILLMICAIVFHISRGEASVIGFNIFLLALATFIAWGRKKKWLQQK